MDMKYAILIVVFLSVYFSIFSMITNAQTAEEFAAAWDKQHVSNILPSNVRHKDLRNYLENLKKIGIKVEEVGRSFANREIYQIEWGKGKTKIFMWSQMHGDEPTATSALIDMFTFLQNNRDKISWVKNLENSITLRAVPMLNPDGAELFQRRNLQGIDLNRDARNLQTPEGRLLKKLRDEWKPEIGFNLHNQNPLTTVGRTPKQAAISLLAVSGNPKGESYPGHERNKRISSLMITALNKFIPEHIGRYDDEYNPRAFGDRISEWGTPVILIETGAMHGRDEMFLVKMNFIAYLTALQSIVDGSEKRADPKIYEKTPFNSNGNLFNFIFRRANIVNFAENDKSFVGDVAVSKERRRAEIATPTFVQEIGDLSVYSGLEEFDASDFYLVPKNGLLKIGSGGEFMFYKKSRKIDWKAKDLEKNYEPDAVFSNGKWIKNDNLLKKLK
ncbi:MAG TPA: M14 family zinc carboxypeptidase [Pyrinomonadaceae bacterium]|jgi:hypothetical protein